MKAKLVSLPNFYNSNLDLTVGKIYDVEEYSDLEYHFSDNGGDKMVLNKDRFEIAHTSEQLIEQLTKHYDGKIEPFDLMDSLGALEGFARGCILKYGSRVGKKEGEDLKDILKIIDFALILARALGIPVTEAQAIAMVQKRFRKWEK